MTYLAYADETGDQGAGGTGSYGIACVMVEDKSWPDVYDGVIDFRRFLAKTFGVPVRAELKANMLLRGSGPYRNLSESARAAIYRQAIRLQPKLGLTTFAIIIDKPAMAARTPKDVRDIAWEYAFQRLERFTTKSGSHALLIHDEGDEHRVRRVWRWMRRAGIAGAHYGPPAVLKTPARLLLDDPSPRSSATSYFLQLADLNAYAAFRRIYPPPVRPVQIVPTTLWDDLAGARLAAVSSVKGGPIGIVFAP